MTKTDNKPMRAWLLAALLSLAFAANAAPETLLIDRIIAVVGEDVVMLSELRREATKLQQRLQQKGVSPMPSDRGDPETGLRHA